MWIDALLGYLPDEEPDSLSNYTQNHYVGILGQLYVTLHDLQQACEVFVDLIFNKGSKNFLSYDGHVSDCGCHLRALMLMALVNSYKQNTCDLDHLQRLAEACESSMQKTRRLIKEICLETTLLKDLDLPKSTKDPQVFIDAVEWDFHSNQTKNIKYLFYCYFLSKFKDYNKRNSKDSVEINLDLAMSSMNRTFLGSSCNGKGKLGNGCRYLKHAKICRGSLKQWITKYQARLSKMSVEFLTLVDESLSDSIENLQRKSNKNVSAVPSYLQFRVLERFWARSRAPLLYTIRYFLKSYAEDIYVKGFVDENMEWDLQLVSPETLQDTPHVIITVQCVTSDHIEDENVDVAKVILQSLKKLRQFWYSFMSKHKQYPFETTMNKDEHLRAILSTDDFENYRFYKNFDQECFLNIQLVPKHIFLEYPSVLFQKQQELEGMKGVLFI